MFFTFSQIIKFIGIVGKVILIQYFKPISPLSSGTTFLSFLLLYFSQQTFY